eukprot:gene4191-5246_t
MTMEPLQSIEPKVVLLGSTDVGKTAISVQYAQGIFPTRPLSTVGASFLAKNINIDGNKIKFQIWDTAGQDRFRSLAPLYYRGASVAILVYDITVARTFEKVKDWVEELRANIHEDIIIVVCGNKIDKPDERRVKREIAKSFADEIKAVYFETSAKENLGIEMMFLEIAKKLLLKNIPHNLITSSSCTSSSVRPESNSCCS